MPLLGRPTQYVYETACTTAQIIAYYTDLLTRQGWTGGFTSPTTSPFPDFSASTAGAGSVTGSASTVSDLTGPARPIAGSFVGATASGIVVALIEVSAGKNAAPVDVQVILQSIPYVASAQGSS
jgi:hypothetical protein